MPAIAAQKIYLDGLSASHHLSEGQERQTQNSFRNVRLRLFQAGEEGLNLKTTGQSGTIHRLGGNFRELCFLLSSGAGATH